MPNLAKILKEEIHRIARREIKAATTGLRKDNASFKRTIADLKRRLAKAESVNKRLLISTAAAPMAAQNNSAPTKARITGKMIRSIRSRLGVSQEAFAKLVKVSPQAVYHWERRDGRLRLRDNSISEILRIRSIGKRNAKKKIAEMEA